MLGTYDPARNTFVWGAITATMVQSIKSSYNEKEQWTFIPSVDGNGGCRVRSGNRSGKIEVELHPTSPTNDLYTAAFKLDLATGLGLSSGTAKDGTGTSTAHGGNCWIAAMPDLELAKDPGMKTWVFETDNLDLVNGGNAPPFLVP